MKHIEYDDYPATGTVPTPSVKLLLDILDKKTKKSMVYEYIDYIVTCPNPDCECYDYTTFWGELSFCPCCGCDFRNPLKEPVDGKILPLEFQEKWAKAIYDMKQIDDKATLGIGVSTKALRQRMGDFMANKEEGL
jgi:hypothetical protein